jgi:AcrR family transcriptional regulator
VRLLCARGIGAFAVEAVARGAGVAKGLVIYHFGSRDALLRECGAALCAERAARLARARSAPGVRGIDACWEELRRQTDDGTTRGWMGVLAAGVAPPARERQDAATHANAALLDGCAIALAKGSPEAAVRECYETLQLALLDALTLADEG